MGKNDWFIRGSNYCYRMVFCSIFCKRKNSLFPGNLDFHCIDCSYPIYKDRIDKTII